MQSRVEESNNDEDILEGHDNGTATSRKGSQSMISLDKMKNIKILGKVRSGSIPDCS